MWKRISPYTIYPYPQCGKKGGKLLNKWLITQSSNINKINEVDNLVEKLWIKNKIQYLTNHIRIKYLLFTPFTRKTILITFI